MDAGVIRSGLLEKLQAEGRIDLAEIEVLDSKSQPDYPYLVTGHLYPEWPFLALPWIDKTLRENVTLALLNTQNPQVRAQFGLLDIWSTPLSYGGVRQLLTNFQAHPRGTNSPVGWMSQNPVLTAFALGILLSLFVGTTLLLILRRIPVRTAPGDAPDTAETLAIRAKFDSLTRREREVLCLLCNGHGSKAIAEDLGISPKTVEFHRANLLQKTQAGTTAHLVQLTTRLGFDLESHHRNLNPAPQR
jgi:DNA-binding CsgD family transcriptional regulator